MDNNILKIYNLLLNKFREQGWWPRFDLKDNRFVYNKNFKHTKPSDQDSFIISISALLAQNTVWKNVEKAINNLSKENLLSKNALMKLENKQLANLIKPSGYFNQKAKKIKEFLKFNKEFNRENLLQVWGIGEETADSILLYAFNHPTFVIDAYTKRIFNRIGFKEKTYKELQDLFHKNLLNDYKLFNEYHALIVELAKRNCKKIPLCNNCSLNSICKKLI